MACTDQIKSTADNFSTKCPSTNSKTVSLQLTPLTPLDTPPLSPSLTDEHYTSNSSNPPETPNSNSESDFKLISSKPITIPSTPISIPLSPSITPPSIPNSVSSISSPLKKHLNFLHPFTPPGIIEFCVIRLLSSEAPFGYYHAHFHSESKLNQSDTSEHENQITTETDTETENEWSPIQHDLNGNFNLLLAGLNLDASKSIKSTQEGRGKEIDVLLERKYKVVRESYKRLEKLTAGGIL